MTNEKMMQFLATLPDAEHFQAGKITDPLGSDALYCARTVVSLLAKEREGCAETAEAAMSDANKYDIAGAIRMRP